MTKQQIDRAKLAGISARQVGKKREANPYAGKPSLRDLGDAWLSGWVQQDRLSTKGRP